MLPTTFLKLAALSVSMTLTASAQSPTLQACSLLTNTEVEKVTGQHEFGDPEPMSLAGGAGSVCTFTMAQVVLFSGDKSEERWDTLMKNYGHENEKRYPVSGIGDRAYFFFPKPRSKFEDTNAFLVVNVGQHTVAISVAAEEGKSAESVRPQALALAKIAVAKLR